MKVLLTGATGLIGKEVGKLLVQRGHEVLSVTRSRAKAELDLPYQTTVIEWKGGDAPFPAEAFESVDAVVNLMGENLSDRRWNDEFKTRLYDSRVASTRTLISGARDSQKLVTWIQGSAIGFYGSIETGVLADEFAPQGQGFLADLCHDWEASLDVLPASVRRVIIRTGVVFSHRGGAFPQMLTPLMNGLGGTLASGSQKMALIHLEDLTRFILHALEHDSVKGAYNLVSTSPIAQKELVEKMCRDLDVKPGPSVPAFALRLAVGEMATVLLENQNVISNRIRETGFEFQYPDPDEILNEVVRWHLNPFHPNTSAFVFYAEQFIPKPIERVFEFFSDAQNLQKVTPESLHFRIEEVSENPIRKNTRIRQALKVHQIPIHWLTNIDEWEPPYHFADHQVEGPYSLWYHDHRFEEVEGGTLVKDWIRYRLPLGKLAQWVGLAKIRSDLNEIFHYRRKLICELNGCTSSKVQPD